MRKQKTTLLLNILLYLFLIACQASNTTQTTAGTDEAPKIEKVEAPGFKSSISEGETIEINENELSEFSLKVNTNESTQSLVLLIDDVETHSTNTTPYAFGYNQFIDLINQLGDAKDREFEIILTPFSKTTLNGTAGTQHSFTLRLLAVEENQKEPRVEDVFLNEFQVLYTSSKSLNIEDYNNLVITATTNSKTQSIEIRINNQHHGYDNSPFEFGVEHFSYSGGTTEEITLIPYTEKDGQGIKGDEFLFSILILDVMMQSSETSDESSSSKETSNKSSSTDTEISQIDLNSSSDIEDHSSSSHSKISSSSVSSSKPNSREIDSLIVDYILYRNNIDDVDFYSIATFSDNTSEARITALELVNMNLDTLPSEITLLDQLEFLEMDSNNISTIPSEIGDLSNLLLFSISSNNITSIPGSLGKLKKLRILSLSENSIDSIPNSLQNLTLLTHLLLFENLVTQLPDFLAAYKEMKVIDIGGNFIIDLPTDIGNLSKLQKLDISYNLIEELPSSIINLSSLQEFYMEENDIYCVEDDILIFLMKFGILDIPAC